MSDAGVDAYSPRRRTALVLTGTGADGAYHAGALRALHEAGVKIDLVAGRGVGVVGALFGAVDGAQRLWDEKGFWRGSPVEALYGWRMAARIAGWALALSVAIVAAPIAAIAVGLVVFPLDFLLKIVGGAGAPGLVSAYLSFADGAFAATALPTWLPRLVFLVLGVAAIIALVDGFRSSDHRLRGGAWWRLVRAPIDAQPITARVWHTLWDLMRGAAHLNEPSPAELAQRYTEMLAENIGQPGFRELVIVAHDVDARRDLVFALVAEGRRRELIRRPTTAAAEARRAEVFDLAGVDRQQLADAVAASLVLPIATDWHHATFNPAGYWRGETHRLADRPASLVRLIDELIELGVQQIILVTAAAHPPGPHALARARLDLRGRLGELLQSGESAVVHDATTTTAGVRIFTIRPAHNPIGPLDFGGGYDDRSHRPQPLSELISRGYEDAYHQFIEPVVGASGELI